ncbi:NTF2 fold immunity protein [Chryseobacterium gossypii]
MIEIYGKKIYNRKPFVARMKNDSIWIVEGTLPEGRRCALCRS